MKLKTSLSAAVCMAMSMPLSAAGLHETPDSARVINIDEVVIIASPKENFMARQTPASISIINKKALDDNHVTGLKELSGIVPNFFMPDYGSRLTSAVYIRGIGSRINTPAVGLYVDNVPYIDKSAFDFNFYDIERVDVLRGPQGTLYGRNTMGGLIMIHTRSPFDYQGTDLRLSLGDYNNYSGSVTHYHRISDKFAFSAGGFYKYGGGFFENTALHEKADRMNNGGGRIRAIVRPTRNLDIDMAVTYEHNDQGGYAYAPFDKVTGAVGQVATNDEGSYRRDMLNASVKVSYTTDDIMVSSVTGYQYLKDRMFLDQDFTVRDIYTLEQKQKLNTITEEIVARSNHKRNYQWTAGAFVFHQSLGTNAPVTFKRGGLDMIEQQIAGAMAGAPVSIGLTNAEMPILGHYDTPLTGVAVYHQSSYDNLFIDGLSLTVGLRLDYEKIKMHYDSGTDMDFDFLFGMGPMHITSENLHAISSFIGEESADYTQLLPKFALEYAWNPQNNVYASVTKGYRSGGYNIQMFSDLIQGSLRNAMIDALAADPNFKRFASMLENFKTGSASIREATLYKPEYSWNYEIGTHLTLFGGKLQADLAAFYMDTRDQQISRFADSGLGRITVNAGKSRSIGAEASLRSQITDALSLYGSYGYTYATFTDYTLSDTEDYNGNYVPFVPKHTFTAGGQYVFRLRKGAWLDNITVNANYRAAGRIYWTEQNNASQPLYGILNGRVSLNKGNGQVGFWINNALNKDYQAFYFETMNRGFAQQGRPLQFGIDLKCRF